MRFQSDRRQPRARGARGAAKLLALAVLGAGLTFAAATTSPRDAGATEVNGGRKFNPANWPALVTADYQNGSQKGDVPLPDCGSVNINGRAISGDNDAYWAAAASVPNGAEVHVGDTITVSYKIIASEANPGNDGVHNLGVYDNVSGPVEEQKNQAKYQVWKDTYHHGNFKVGVKVEGTKIYADSSPRVYQQGDGIEAQVTRVYKATALGTIKLDNFTMGASDPTGFDYYFECSIPIGFSWKVVAPKPPTSGADIVATDSSYTSNHPMDANGGRHGLLIDVLANDRDPEASNQPGNTGEVRIKSWTAQSIKGGVVNCGPNNGTSNFNQMGTLCRYTPPQNVNTGDSFRYFIASKKTGLTREVQVNVQLRSNGRPTTTARQFILNENQQIVNGPLKPQIKEPNAEPFTCGKLAGPASVTVDSDCTFDYDPAGVGEEAFTYWTCDQHQLLTEFGDIAASVGDYALGNPDDLSPSSSRLCANGQIQLSVTDVEDPQGLPLPPVAVSDDTTVDAGYGADGVGPYQVRVPVLANDFDPTDPEFPAQIGELSVFDSDPALGTASIDGQDLLFSPAEGVEGPVQVQYRICDDPAAQNPPIVDNPNTPPNEALGTCGVGTVTIDVVPNGAPVAAVDAVEIANDTELPDLDLAANDSDPDGEALACQPGALEPVPAGIVASVTIEADCTVDIVPVAEAEGVATAPYSVCDTHVLTDTPEAASPYGADGRSPGDVAPRCTSSTLTIGVVGSEPPPPPPPPPPADQPTCREDQGQTTTDVEVALAVLANDDAVATPGDDPGAMQVVGVGSAGGEGTTDAGGTVDVTGGAVRYRPAAGFTGTDSFEYQAAEGSKTCKATVTVKVRAAQRPDGPDGDDGGQVDGAGTDDGPGYDGGYGSYDDGYGYGEPLPRTGSSSTLPLARTGLVLLAVGAVALVAGRRRVRRAPAV